MTDEKTFINFQFSVIIISCKLGMSWMVWADTILQDRVLVTIQDICHFTTTVIVMYHSFEVNAIKCLGKWKQGSWESYYDLCVCLIRLTTVSIFDLCENAGILHGMYSPSLTYILCI